MTSLSLNLTMTSATESLFFEFEFRIQNKVISLSALEQYIEKLKMKEQYYSLVDFLICELFPEYKKLCKKFYKTGDNPLREILTIEDKVGMETTLLLLLDLVEVFYSEGQKVSWTEIKEILPRVSFSTESY